jgi:high-affinity Fe2+/Pb2+ permease
MGMDDRQSKRSDDGEGQALAKLNSQLGQIVSQIWGFRWGLRFGTLLPALLAAGFLYDGFTTHSASKHMEYLIIGSVWAFVVVAILAWSVLGDWD